MSMERCQGCGTPIDTDFDSECYVDDPRHSIPPHPDLILCEHCREVDQADEPDELEMAQAFHELESERLAKMKEARNEHR